MSTEYRLSYTAAEIDEKLGKIDNLVSSVNGVMPDINGNVEITIPDSGNNIDMNQYVTKDEIPDTINAALAEAKASGEFDGENGYSPTATVTQTVDGASISITDKNGTTTATIINGKNGVFVRNLLDNSDFRNPVNQRGQTEYKGAVYGIDRWFCTHVNWMVSVEDGHIRISDNPDSTNTKIGMLKQIIPITPDIAGKVVTLVAKLKGDDVRININDQEKTEGKYGGYDGISSYVSDGEEYTIVTATTVLPTDAETFFVALQFKNETNFICDWMALYEGVYTKDTAPEYQPKGYGAELAECQRYYQIINNGVGSVRTNEDKILVTLPLCVSMRNAISVASAKIATVRANGLRIDNPEFEITTAVAYKDYNSACVIELGGTFTGMANGIAYIDGRFHLCADFL